MAIKLRVLEPYPCWIRFESAKGVMYIQHTELAALEQAVAEAKRQVLAKLPPDRHHEVDPVMANWKGLQATF